MQIGIPTDARPDALVTVLSMPLQQEPLKDQLMLTMLISDA